MATYNRRNSDYRRRNYSNRQKRKHWDCKLRKRDGDFFITGWNYTKGLGLRSFLASPYRSTKTWKNDKGQTVQNWMVKINIGGLESITSGFYYEHNKQVIVPSADVILRPSTGYCGTMRRRR